ncbi:MAG: hypothetical protein R3190_11970, partial [Thermoanaerobaculia bacterium]|nr:hypothetical protein [Thermoanaerobaculia bacterium]
DVERARWRLTGTYRFHRRVQAGIEFNPEVDEINPLLSLFLLTETNRRPALFLGTSSDRIGSPEGTQSYFATVSKRFGDSRFSAYASLNYSEWDRGFNLPVGLEVGFGEHFSVRPMSDGSRPHLMLNYFRDRWGVSLLAVDLEYPGVSFAVGF